MTDHLDNGKGHSWHRHSADLADWTWQRLVNRRDAWGRYGSAGPYTAPPVSQRGRLLLTTAILRRHYAATARSDVAGVHSTSPENTSLWGALDIDHHSDDSPDPETNLRAALAWYARLQALGFRPLLTDSNGKGGFHLRALFREPVPTAKVFAFMQWLTRDHRTHGLPGRPECFPKQPRVERFGNWLRLPGRHHSRDHWSRAWGGERWLDGVEAVQLLLSHDGDNPALIPADVDRFTRPPAPVRSFVPTVARPTEDALTRRIAAYVARVPHAAEGQGRDDHAYRLAAFLARDLALSDDEALPWLLTWDAGNAPPKGEARLLAILQNVRRHGQRPIGCGLGAALSGGKSVRFTVEV